MQAEHIALSEQLLQADEIAALGGLARRIADPHVPAQPAQYFDQAPADLAGTDHAEGQLGQLGPGAFRQRRRVR